MEGQIRARFEKAIKVLCLSITTFLLFPFSLFAGDKWVRHDCVWVMRTVAVY